MNKCLTAILLALSASASAQKLQPAPRLVVNITIDQLRTDYIQAFAPLYGQGGFKKLLSDGCVYEAASYNFVPVDRASAVASISSGTTPYYNNIVSSRWLDRTTLRPVYCVADSKVGTSPRLLSTSTIGDELKVATGGSALVYAFAVSRDAAVLSVGHAADGAVWIDDATGVLSTSAYYPQKTQKWLNAYNAVYSQRASDDRTRNLAVIHAAQSCVTEQALGRDAVTDYLAVTLSAKGRGALDWQTDMEGVYTKLDQTLSDFIGAVETAVGKDHVLFMVTSTGYTDEENIDYSKYKVPTGTFYINRTANLLNVYLGAVYGQGKYVEACYHNEIYLNHKLIEQKRMSLSEVLVRCQEFLIQNSGVRDVYTTNSLLVGGGDTRKIRNGHHPAISGDIIVEVAPGWQLYNEDNQERYTCRASFVPFPIIFYGARTPAQHIETPVSVEHIAPTIAKIIRIRAPNACKVEPLF